MESLLNVIRSNMLVQAVVFIVLGLFVLLWPGVTITTVIYLFGAFFAISGIASLISYQRAASPAHHSPAVLTSGVFMLVLALIVFLFPEAIASVFSLLLGIVLALCGVVSAVRSWELRPLGGYTWVVGLVVSVAVAIGGVIIIANPFETTLMFIYVLGGLMVLNGAGDLLIELAARREQRELRARR